MYPKRKKKISRKNKYLITFYPTESSKRILIKDLSYEKMKKECKRLLKNGIFPCINIQKKNY